MCGYFYSHSIVAGGLLVMLVPVRYNKRFLRSFFK